VVDGIPMDNTQFGNAGVWGGTDDGDGLNSINPDDIESITVLKGAAAAALYGSRGGFGVINITTKRGSARKGLGIEFSSNYVFEKAINYFDLQEVYGQGDLVSSNPSDPDARQIASRPKTAQQAFQWGTSSWGEKLDGVPTIMWDGQTRPYSLIGLQHNWDSFFQTGGSWTNTLAISGGSEKQTFRFSFSNMNSTGVIPNTGFDRKNVSLSTNGKFGKKITFNAKVLYSNEFVKNRPMISDSPGNAVQALMRLPTNYDILDLKGDPNKLGAVPEGVVLPNGVTTGAEYAISEDLWNQNPYWAAYQFRHNDTRDRFITSGELRYDITSFLYIRGRIGMDYYNRKGDVIDAPEGTAYDPNGSMTESQEFRREINQEWTMGFDKAFGKINVNAFVGGNKMTRKNESISANGYDFVVPWFNSIRNGSSQTWGYGYGNSGINSLYGSAEVSYGGYLYITGTARNDWFSVLNPANNSKLYPSVGGSFVFTDAFKSLPEVISFGKVRAAWGQVATANLGAYQANLTYSFYANGHLGRQLGGYSNESNMPNPDLVPALSTEIEFGAEMRFYQDRLGFDFTYYSQKTTDDILQGTISQGSGFYTTSLNIGELSNKGIELQINGTPVRGPLTWDISLNLAKNKNKVIRLSEGINSIQMEEPRTRTVFVKNIVGYPFGMLTGLVQKRDDAGNRIYTSDNKPVQSDEYQIIGNGVADLTGGLNNSLTFKGFNLTFLLDFKAGGDIYSGTNVRLLEQGLTKESLIGREGGLQITGVFEDGSGGYTGVETRTLDHQDAENYWSYLGERDEAHFTYDASFVKLRQLTFGYNFPSSLLSKTPMKSLSLSFVARNLAILYKNSPNIDPESTYTTSSSQGLDYFGLPATRTFGFNLKATF
jgi:TonB-linked SusC/RagA family outer membrane protein